MPGNTASMSKNVAVVLATALAFVATPATAFAEQQDAISTRTYLRADYALQLAVKESIPAEREAANDFISEVESQCPNAMAGAPHTKQTSTVDSEILGAMIVALSKPEDRASIKFAHAVENLRWSSRKLTHTVTSYTAELRAQTRLATPNLCSDIKAWVASGYTTLTASTLRFSQQFDDIITKSGPGDVPLRLFAPYEHPGDRAIITRIKLLERQQHKSQEPLSETTLSQISKALGTTST